MRFISRKILIFILPVVFAGCTTSPKLNSSSPSQSNHKENKIKIPSKTTTADEIDYPSIQRLLGLDVNFKELGFIEKSFNTCQVGFGYSKTENCRAQFFIIANFRLLCRDSEGTISTILTEDDLRPVPHQDIHWFLKNADGFSRTDNEGYGQIVFTSSLSQKNQRLRLSNSKDFLLLRASDTRRLIVPKNWCAD